MTRRTKLFNVLMEYGMTAGSPTPVSQQPVVGNKAKAKTSATPQQPTQQPSSTAKVAKVTDFEKDYEFPNKQGQQVKVVSPVGEVDPSIPDDAEDVLIVQNQQTKKYYAYNPDKKLVVPINESAQLLNEINFNDGALVNRILDLPIQCGFEAEIAWPPPDDHSTNELSSFYAPWVQDELSSSDRETIDSYYFEYIQDSTEYEEALDDVIAEFTDKHLDTYQEDFIDEYDLSSSFDDFVEQYKAAKKRKVAKLVRSLNKKTKKLVQVANATQKLELPSAEEKEQLLRLRIAANKAENRVTIARQKAREKFNDIKKLSIPQLAYEFATNEEYISDYRDFLKQKAIDDEDAMDQVLRRATEECNVDCWLTNEYGSVRNGFDALDISVYEDPLTVDYVEEYISEWADENSFVKTVTAGAYHTTDEDEWGVEEDSSIGAPTHYIPAEIISPVYPNIRAMLKEMKSLFEYFKQHDVITNQTTGLHITMSMGDEVDMPRPDLVKMSVLLGEPYVLKSFDRLHNSYTQSVYDRVISAMRKQNLTDESLQDIGELVRNSLERVGVDRQSAINIKSYTNDSMNHHVEFRALGNKDYHTKFDSIEKQAIRFGVVMYAGSSRTAFSREYLKGLSNALAKSADLSRHGTKLASAHNDFLKVVRQLIPGNTMSDRFAEVYNKYASNPSNEIAVQLLAQLLSMYINGRTTVSNMQPMPAKYARPIRLFMKQYSITLASLVEVVNDTFDRLSINNSIVVEAAKSFIGAKSNTSMLGVLSPELYTVFADVNTITSGFTNESNILVVSRKHANNVKDLIFDVQTTKPGTDDWKKLEATGRQFGINDISKLTTMATYLDNRVELINHLSDRPDSSNVQLIESATSNKLQLNELDFNRKSNIEKIMVAPIECGFEAEIVWPGLRDTDTREITPDTSLDDLMLVISRHFDNLEVLINSAWERWITTQPVYKEHFSTIQRDLAKQMLSSPNEAQRFVLTVLSPKFPEVKMELDHNALSLIKSNPVYVDEFQQYVRNKVRNEAKRLAFDDAKTALTKDDWIEENYGYPIDMIRDVLGDSVADQLTQIGVASPSVKLIYSQISQWAKTNSKYKVTRFGKYHQHKALDSRQSHWRVEGDGSVQPTDPSSPAGEIISPVYDSIGEMLNEIELLFAYLKQNNIETNHTTGLHVTLSYAGEKVAEPNMLKLSVLMNDPYVLDMFDRAENDYADSNWLKLQQYAKVPLRDLIHQSKSDADSSAVKEIEDYVSKIAQFAQDKSSAVYLRPETNSLGNRMVEFRAAGGPGYIEQLTKVRQTIIRYAMSYQSSLSDTTDQIDYYRNLLKLISGAKSSPDLSAVTLFVKSMYAGNTNRVITEKQDFFEFLVKIIKDIIRSDDAVKSDGDLSVAQRKHLKNSFIELNTSTKEFGLWLNINHGGTEYKRLRRTFLRMLGKKVNDAKIVFGDKEVLAVRKDVFNELSASDNKQLRGSDFAVVSYDDAMVALELITSDKLTQEAIDAFKEAYGIHLPDYYLKSTRNKVIRSALENSGYLIEHAQNELALIESLSIDQLNKRLKLNKYLIEGAVPNLSVPSEMRRLLDKPLLANDIRGQMAAYIALPVPGLIKAFRDHRALQGDEADLRPVLKQFISAYMHDARKQDMGINPNG